METMPVLRYFLKFYCTRCKGWISFIAVAPDYNHAVDRMVNSNVQGHPNLVGQRKCDYPGKGHTITSITLTGVEFAETNRD